MKAVDTNVIVRLLIEDDLAQAERARAIFGEEESETIFISKTVLLEAEWVLRGGYKVPKMKIFESLEALLGLANVTVEAPTVVRNALDWAQDGLDFADALHLASVPRAEEGDGERRIFLTFDRDLALKSAAIKDAVQVVLAK
ncbi:MAG TPA: type II toxin-antitoxin system VapC family toxin [Alphaproteobacteria bacterium]|nr:type II toxin-antitoxin system VapC family toxin [Alphaproteobacteria bacterium]